MATNITKGTEVWMFGDYDHKATVRVVRLTITSWGKKHGTAVRFENGKPAQHRIYTYRDLSHIVPVADLPDPAEEGMRRAIAQKARWVQHYVDRAHHYCDSASHGYHESMKKDCMELLAAEPTVLIVGAERAEPVEPAEQEAAPEYDGKPLGEIFETFVGSGKFDGKGREIGYIVGLRDNGTDFFAWVQNARRVKGEFKSFGATQRSKKFGSQEAANRWGYATAKARIANLK